MNVVDLSYQHNKRAPYFFRNIAFQLEKGKLHALHGKNGTGKSVLLNLLSGNNPSGSVLQGTVVSEGIVCQVNQRFDRMIADKFSFDDNLRFARMKCYPSLYRGLKTHVESFDFIDSFHIDRSNPVFMLSGGQRQILALLMMMQKPVDILLLDEPTATLDEENALLVFEFLTALTRNGMTVFVVCHDQDLVGRHVTGCSLCIEKTTDGSRTIRMMDSTGEIARQRRCQV